MFVLLNTSVTLAHFCTFQNELRMLFTALSESKHQLLQKMAGTMDRPASKQLEVSYQIKRRSSKICEIVIGGMDQSIIS